MRIRMVIDRIVVSCMATGQLLYSGYSLWYLLIGRGPAVIFAYMLWGATSACLLLTGRRWARVIATAWQGTLLFEIWKMEVPHNAFTSAVWVVPPALYLGATAILQFHKRQAG